MAVITDAMAAEVKRGVKTLYGQILTRPLPLVSDGVNVTYACDVNIGPTDPTGRDNQYYAQYATRGLFHRAGDIRTVRPGAFFGLFGETYRMSGDLTGLPGQPPEDFQIADLDTVNTVLHNVAIGRGNADLIYADVGNAVTLNRSATGQWEITGFSQEMPGTHTRIPVNLGDFTIGTVIDLSLTTRLLNLGELGSLRPFGNLPLGASAIFLGGVLQSIV